MMSRSKKGGEYAYKKIFLNCCIFLVLNMMLASCGGNHEDSGTTSEAFKYTQVESSVVDSSVAKSEFPDENTVQTAIDENVITIAGLSSTYFIQKTADAFNQSQDKYRVEVQRYTSMSKILTDITRKQGADIYFMENMDYASLAEKNVFEDLTPYFEKSEEVDLDDLVESIRRAGNVEGKFFYVIPRFTPRICLVEKGYTDNGVWAVADYFALSEKYPQGRLDVNIDDPGAVLRGNLALVFDSYINWENRTCSFESESFVRLLKKLKNLSERKYENVEDLNVAEKLQQNQLLVVTSDLMWDINMSTYKAMRDSVLTFGEIAGLPNEERSLKYAMSYNEMYAINAGSGNKEGAWAFLEYILSEEYQRSLQAGENGNMLFDAQFPARKDVLEDELEEEVTSYREEKIYYRNPYTNEQVMGVGEFTEEDKEIVMQIVENCYCNGAIDSGKINIIISEEVDYFFKGSKSAEEVAKVIQSRMSLYLME